MDNKPITIMDWPKAILHLDGDSFFASVSKALDPSLKDKAVVTGGERGVATAMSQEAKKLGITRGMPIAKVKENIQNALWYLATTKHILSLLRNF